MLFSRRSTLRIYRQVSKRQSAIMICCAVRGLGSKIHDFTVSKDNHLVQTVAIKILCVLYYLYLINTSHKIIACIHIEKHLLEISTQ